MRVRTFTAPSMPAAMEQVRQALGDDAVILSSESSARGVKITAAIDAGDDDLPAPAAKSSFAPLTSRDNAPDDLRFALQEALRFHNIPELFIAKMLQRATGGALPAAVALSRGKVDKSAQLSLAMEKMLSGFFQFSPLPIPHGHAGRRLMLVGTPGIGKTLTTAKIAARVALAKQPMTVITTDTKRAGGIEQLKAFTDILSQPLLVAASRSELWRHVSAQPPEQAVLIDTAGCNPYNEEEWNELHHYATLDGIEPVLVLPAGGDSAEAIDMTERFAELPIKRLLITRTDATRRFGGALAAAAAHGLSFAHASTSASLADSLYPLDAGLLASLLLRYQSQPH
jgi:flagellar biosynthesis protein FlhF